MKTIASLILILAAGGCSRGGGADTDAELEKQLAELRRTIPFKAYEESYPNGQLKERGRVRFLGYVCGRPWTDHDGMLEGWYASGVKQCEMPYKNGDLEGVALNWFPNGKKKYIVTWKAGKRDGAFTVFYDSEIVSSRGRFNAGRLAEAEFFDREGKGITRAQWVAMPGNRSFWD